nr:hypothetical protein [Tanacetum cinerariifolium]
LFSGKLNSRWYGPFSVSKDMKNGAIELYDEDGNEFIVNKQRMKPYQESVLDTNKDDDITLDDEGEVTKFLIKNKEEIFIDAGDSVREISSVDKLEPQLLPNFSRLDVNLEDKRGTDPPINPHIMGSFRMKVVDHLTIPTPPLPKAASFKPKDMYCYYHPCIDDPKKHYGFKPSLLGQNGSLCIDFSVRDDRR